MIVEAEFEDYRAFSQLRVSFEPLTVFVGPNACGKTSLLRGVEDGLAMSPGTSSDAQRRGAPNFSVVRLRFSDPEGVVQRQGNSRVTQDDASLLGAHVCRRLQFN